MGPSSLFLLPVTKVFQKERLTCSHCLKVPTTCPDQRWQEISIPSITDELSVSAMWGRILRFCLSWAGKSIAINPYRLPGACQGSVSTHSVCLSLPLCTSLDYMFPESRSWAWFNSVLWSVQHSTEPRESRNPVNVYSCNPYGLKVLLII